MNLSREPKEIATDVRTAEAPWLGVMAGLLLIELAWWGAAYRAGLAPAPLLPTYAILTFAALALASIVRRVARRTAAAATWPYILAGTAMLAVGASLFLPLKYAIPGEIGFWLDKPLATAERSLLGTDPWLVLQRALGGMILPLDRIYGLWLPTQLLVLFAAMLEPPSPAKSHALIAYSLAWFLLGVVAATILSSAGPIFYDRLFGGGAFASLRTTLEARGAVMTIGESDAMWASYAGARPGLVAGMSAVPSIHVAVSVWIYLTARVMAPRWAAAALAYVVLIAIGSVALGWHYVTDGVAGATGMVLVWRLAAALNRSFARRLAPA